MQLSDIKLDAHFLAGTTSGTYPDSSLVRNLNIAYADVARQIWSSAAGWQYDDTNKSTLPVAKTTLVHNRQDYTLPTDAQRIHRVEVKDHDGNWTKLNPFDPTDTKFALPEYYGSAGIPLYYDLVGRSINLYPAPASASVTLASGIAVYVDRDITNFAVTATTTEPGFAAPFHRILSYAAALDFVRDEADRKFMQTQKARLEFAMKEFYAHRMVERKTRVVPSTKNNWKRYT